MGSRRLTFLELNTQSLIANYRRLELYGMMKNYKPDFVMVSETRLKSRYSINFPGFVMVRNDEGQGVALFIRNSIRFSEVHVPDVSVPVVLVEVRLRMAGDSKRMLVGSIYVPAGTSGEDLLCTLNSIKRIGEGYDSVVIGGDWNARHGDWGDRGSNALGTRLKNWLNNTESELGVISPRTPTFPQGVSILDFFFLRSATRGLFSELSTVVRWSLFLTTMR